MTTTGDPRHTRVERAIRWGALAVGIVLFFGTWPMFNTVAALGVNAVVLVALLILHWTPPPG